MKRALDTGATKLSGPVQEHIQAEPSKRELETHTLCSLLALGDPPAEEDPQATRVQLPGS